MLKESVIIELSPSIGKVSGEYIVPDNPVAMLTLAHGAGAGMNHIFMITLAETLASKGIATLRYNFPFIENKKKRADVPAVAHKTVEAAIKEANSRYHDLPLFVSGKSFGGRMSSQFLAAHPDPNVHGIIFYGFPLHPAKQPSIDRAAHLNDVKTKMLFLQGTRDELATWHLIEEVCGSLSLATLIKIEGADHAFKAGKQNVVAILAEETRKWMEELKIKNEKF